MNSEMNVDVCSYSDFTFDKLYLKEVPSNNNYLKYVSIKKNKKDYLFVLSPWTEIIYHYSGVVNKGFEGELIEYPTDFKIDINDEDDAQLEFANKLRDLDTYFKSSTFKDKYLGKNYKGTYYPLYNEQHKWVKAKLQYVPDGDKKKMSTTVYNVFSYPDKPSKFFKKPAEEIDTALKLKYRLQKQRNVRFVLLPTSVWYSNSGYGIKMKIVEVQIGTNKKDFKYSENN